MAKITYIEHSGTEHVLDIPVGLSVMQGAVTNRVRGIIGECGGCCYCATCHVYVDPAWLGRVGEISEMEEVMLEEVIDQEPNSRLSCQICVTDELDGLIVRLPKKQL